MKTTKPVDLKISARTCTHAKNCEQCRSEGVGEHFRSDDDRAYTEQRNRLIPEAEKEADMFAKKDDDKSWTRIFHLAMNRLAKNLNRRTET